MRNLARGPEDLSQRLPHDSDERNLMLTRFENSEGAAHDVHLSTQRHLAVAHRDPDAILLEDQSKVAENSDKALTRFACPSERRMTSISARSDTSASRAAAFSRSSCSARRSAFCAGACCACAPRHAPRHAILQLSQRRCAHIAASTSPLQCRETLPFTSCQSSESRGVEIFIRSFYNNGSRKIVPGTCGACPAAGENACRPAAAVGRRRRRSPCYSF